MTFDCKIKEKYLYRAYELNIESEVLLPELLPLEHRKYVKPDISICYGEVPKNVRQSIDKGQTFNFEKNKMWFFIKKVAILYIYNGNTIIVDLYENYNKDHLRLFILGSAFGMLLLQRNNVAVHGSALVIDGKSVIFTGLSGAGKSTLSVALRNRGYKFLTDDISVIGENSDGSFIVKPGFPQQKLCMDAMIKMNYSIEKFTKVNDDRDKYALSVGSLFSKKSAPLAAIFELVVDDVDNVEITKVTSSEKLLRMMKNIYLIEVTRYSGMDNSFFKKCIEIANKTSYYRISRPKKGFSIDQQIELIIEKLKQ